MMLGTHGAALVFSIDDKGHSGLGKAGLSIPKHLPLRFRLVHISTVHSLLVNGPLREGCIICSLTFLSRISSNSSLMDDLSSFLMYCVRG